MDWPSGAPARFFCYPQVLVKNYWALSLLYKARHLTMAGFHLFWGAFTFPMAAFVTLMLILAQSEGGSFRLLAGLALTGATLSTPPIAYRIVKMSVAGSLAGKTNASHV